MRLKLLVLLLGLAVVCVANANPGDEGGQSPSSTVIEFTPETVKLADGLTAEKIKAATKAAKIGTVTVRGHKLGLYCRVNAAGDENATLRCVVGAASKEDRCAVTDVFDAKISYSPLRLTAQGEAIDRWVDGGCRND